jgi:saccharopine dehydrogenase-like NADP-dependent oxidoreductase
MAENRRIEKSNNFNVVGSNKIKRPKQDDLKYLKTNEDVLFQLYMWTTLSRSHYLIKRGGVCP